MSPTRDCCRGLTCQFGDRRIAKEEARLERKGPDRTTRMLVDALRAAGVEGATVLDVGAGLGALQAELLAAGAARAVHVEASPACAAAAERRAGREGYRDRIEYRVGDFVELATGLEATDVVTLDRVICCDPDLQRLVARSADKSRRLYGAVYPRDRWAVKATVGFKNLLRRLARKPFRVHVHRVGEIEALLRDRGLRRRSTSHTFVWEVAVFERVPAPDS